MNLLGRSGRSYTLVAALTRFIAEFRNHMFNDFYRDRRVLVTGHTGFKGSWLCQWLLKLGAEVQGYALAPPTNPNLFEQLGLCSHLADTRADIRDRNQLTTVIRDFHPEIIFHLAAQPLVRYSYQNPVETYETNVMGSINVLEVLRTVNRPCVAIMVSSDKCYENHEWLFGYREVDPMGGVDPYSSSKGMAELAIAAYRQSYFTDCEIRVASVRAGNVIGGGDWAVDRIVPDCIRALSAKKAIEVRNPAATRPWQHVLEPLRGYLWLAANLVAADDRAAYETAFNFGPTNRSNRSVVDLITEVLKHWPGGHWEDVSDPKAVHESSLLHLSIDRAASVLQWYPQWGFQETIAKTVEWYQSVLTNPQTATEITRRQIDHYELAIAGGQHDER